MVLYVILFFVATCIGMAISVYAFGTGGKRKFHLGSHYLIQTIYAHVHSDISLADIVLGTLIQSKHTASSFS